MKRRAASVDNAPVGDSAGATAGVEVIVWFVSLTRRNRSACPSPIDRGTLEGSIARRSIADEGV
jgi:hypothetical protein